MEPLDFFLLNQLMLFSLYALPHGCAGMQPHSLQREVCFVVAGRDCVGKGLAHSSLMSDTGVGVDDRES